MKALISINNGKVVQVEAESFPVHPSLVWIECDNSVTPGYVYENGSFVAPEIPIIPEQSYADKRREEYNAQGCTIEALTVALWEKEEGMPEVWNKLQVIREQIKTQYPKV